MRWWMSAKPDAFVRGIAAECPGVPPRYGAHHFLRDVAQPVLDADSRAQGRMRRTIRGWRTMAREVVAEQRVTAPTMSLETPPGEPPTAAPGPSAGPAEEEGREVVRDDCAAPRGILNDAHGGPLHPPGFRMAAALGDVRASLPRHLEAQKGGVRMHDARAWPAIATAG